MAKGKTYKKDISDIEKKVWAAEGGWRNGGMVFNFVEGGVGDGEAGWGGVVLCVECKSVEEKEFVGVVMDSEGKKREFLAGMRGRYGDAGLLPPYSEGEVTEFEEKFDVVLPGLLRWYLVNVSRQLMSEVGGGGGVVELSLGGLYSMRGLTEEEGAREIVEGIGEVVQGCDRGTETVLLRLLRHEGAYVHDLVVRGKGAGKVLYYKPGRGGAGKCGFMQEIGYYIFDTVDTLHTIVGNVSEWYG